MKEIQVFEGNSVDLVFHVTDPKGCAFDLTGATAVSFGLATSPRKEAYKVLTLGSGVLISNAKDGVITVQLDSDSTSIVGRRVFELTVAMGSDVYTAAVGEIEFLPSIMK